MGISIREQLGGEKAFYKQVDYRKRTIADMTNGPVEPCFEWNTENKVWRIFKEVLSLLCIPLALYNGLHYLAGLFPMVPATMWMWWEGCSKKDLGMIRADTLNYNQNEWRYKRICVEVDGTRIDAVIVGKEKTLDNGKWVLNALGNGMLYEHYLRPWSEELQLANALEANAIFFNYPAVGESGDLAPSRSTMKKAHRVMLKFLENKEKGIGAKKIVSFGYSIGGGVQNDAFSEHELQKDITYVNVKSHTFHTIAKVAEEYNLSWLAKILGWNIGSENSSKTVQCPEIIMQTANVRNYTILSTSELLVHDGFISAEASHAKAILDDPECDKSNKIILGVPEGHEDPFTDIPYLAHFIRTSLNERL